MKISIHPLFLAVGLFTALFGGFTVFIICALTALLHECGHIFCAEKLGFECTRVRLMPYGAAAVCELDGISPADEIRLALSGPLVNFLICVAVAGLWWFVPQVYAYTDLLFYANAGMLVLNLLPAYPLDGGRVARCALLKCLKPRTVNLILRGVNVALVAVIVALFFTVYHNLSLLAAAVMLLCSAFSPPPPARRIDFAARKKKRGREVRYVILSEDATFRDALRYMDASRYLVLQIYSSDDKFLDEITEDELCALLQTKTLYEKIV